jgi:hypothetical protein
LQDRSDQQKHFREHPEEYTDYCKKLKTEISRNFKIFLNRIPAARKRNRYDGCFVLRVDSTLMDVAAQCSIREMKTKLADRADIIEWMVTTNFGLAVVDQRHAAFTSSQSGR